MKKIMCHNVNCSEFIIDDAAYDYEGWTCTTCYEKAEMIFFGWRDIDSDLMHSRMADAEMGDL